MHTIRFPTRTNLLCVAFATLALACSASPPATDSGVGTDGGLRPCASDSDCVLEAVRCCGWCDGAPMTESELVGVHMEDLAAHRAVCAGIGCDACREDASAFEAFCDPGFGCGVRMRP